MKKLHIILVSASIAILTPLAYLHTAIQTPTKLTTNFGETKMKVTWNPIEALFGSNQPQSSGSPYADPNSQVISNAPRPTYNQWADLQKGIIPSGSAGGGGGGGGGGGWGDAPAQASAPSGPSIDQAVLDQYDQAIGRTNRGIDRLGNELKSGYSTIDSQYENAINQLLRSRNLAEQGYNTNKQQTATDFVGSKNTIGANAGRSLSGLQRLLGSRGAGGGSAARIVAPDAVAREATIQRQGVTSQFGQNNQALDTTWNNYLGDYENQRSGVAQQREQGREGLKRTVDTNRAGLLEVLADLKAKRAQAAGGDAVGAARPYLDRADSILDRVVNYRVDPIKYQTKAYDAPELDAYTVNPNATPQYEGQEASNDYYSPYLAALLGKKKQSGLAA